MDIVVAHSSSGQTAEDIVGSGALGECRLQRNAEVRLSMSKTRSFQLGKKWRWRVDVIGLGTEKGHLLTAFELGAEKYLAWLTLERGGNHAILVRYEFHGEEPGWHCHSLCGEVDKVPVALVKPYGTIRVPKARARHRRMIYGVTEQNALAIAFKAFRINAVAQGTFL